MVDNYVIEMLHSNVKDIDTKIAFINGEIQFHQGLIDSHSASLVNYNIRRDNVLQAIEDLTV